MYSKNKKNWYILQTFSSCENEVVYKIQENIQKNNIKKLFGKILIPSEQLIEFKNGKKKNSESKFFPGYILINMHINEKSWYLIKNIPKIIGFIGGEPDRPIPIKKKIIKKIIQKLQKIGNKPRPKIFFNHGETIRINNGSFTGLIGTVEKTDYEKNRLTVLVLIFGRSTPLELSFNKVEKQTN